ncbi:hypothetical protein LINPERPRIM_LOCUS24867 [Linum perenne]
MGRKKVQHELISNEITRKNNFQEEENEIIEKIKGDHDSLWSDCLWNHLPQFQRKWKWKWKRRPTRGLAICARSK